MLQIFNNFLDANAREIKRLSQIVTQINSQEKPISKLTDAKLKERSMELKKKIQKELEDEKNNGQNVLNKYLPEAFALVREASSRSVKMRHFDVQLMAGVALHEGKIAEQKTGEGKTLTATAPLYLNALAGKGTHLVTVNDYLARRDAGWNGPIFHTLGITVAAIIHEQAFLFDPKFSNKETNDPRLKHLKPISRKEAYGADITYGTNNEFGFDYLRDNMVVSLADKSQRGQYFAIVDEVDSILIDEARTPLIISSPAEEATDKYIHFTQIIDKLQSDTDFVVDEKLRTSNLTEHGIIKIEKLLGVDNLYEKDFATLHHIEEALQAKTLFRKDEHYIVKDGEVIIVDEFTGRLMPGRRYSEGLHQAIEAKEGVQIQQESKTWATISFQNYFRMYSKLAGMTGTAATEAEEFHKIYKLEVVIVPTNQPMVRKDFSDAIYKTVGAKYTAVANEIEELHAKGQPILVGTTSIEKNEFLSDLLKKKRISHALLNAKNHEREAEIIADAGQKGAVTVATNLAGRGVDIKLGKGVDKLGGLYVMGTERHESRRIDNQLRGRSGRQGDPGGTKFFVSLEDDLMRIFGGDQVAKVMTALKMPEDVPIEHGLVSKAIESAQKKVEGHNFDIRKHTVEYDDVMNQQRQIIYGVRDQILEAAADLEGAKSKLKEDILQKVAAEISNIVAVYGESEIDYDKIVSEFTTIIPFDDNSKNDLVKQLKDKGSVDEISDTLVKLSKDVYEAKETQLTPDVMRQMEVFVSLTTLDTLWVEHLSTMDDLRAGIGLRGYAQRDPLIEYKREGFDLFEKLITTIDAEVVHRIYKQNINSDGGQIPIVVGPVVDLKAATQRHDEALDETQLLEDVGQLMPITSAITSSSDGTGVTKVKVERDGQVIRQDTYGGDGGLQNSYAKVGRNDPCPCGSGLKFKRCHLNRPLA